MPRQTLTQFAETCAAETELPNLWRAALDFYADRGIDKVCYHSDDAAELDTPGGIIAAGFPEDWLKHYIGNDLVRVDPIPALTLLHTRPFLWSEAHDMTSLTPREVAYMEELATAVGGDGLALQACGPNLRNAYVGLGFAPDVTTLSGTGIFELQCAAQMSHIRYCELTPNRYGVSATLSPREREILGWIAQGKSNSVIADILELSTHTVDTIVRRIFDKLDVHDRTSAAIKGIGAGVLRYDLLRAV